MLSIGSFARHGKKNHVARAGNNAAGARRVLPRVLRRPTRLFNRLLAGNVAISKSGWVTMVLGVAVIASLGVLANSRHGHSIVAAISANMGFMVNQVSVEGIDEVSKIDVLARLDFGASKSLFSFDVVKAREDLRKLAWVSDAVVAKSYPDRLIIRISERQPFAIWQNGNELALIERDGETIDRFDDRFAALPLLVGKGANVDGADIVYLVEKVFALKDRVKAYVRIAERRWDLRLKNGMAVRLPDENPADALRQLARFDEVYNLLDRDLEVVDLRLKDRIVVALSKAAWQRRDAQSGKSTSGYSTSGNGENKI